MPGGSLILSRFFGKGERIMKTIMIKFSDLLPGLQMDLAEAGIRNEDLPDASQSLAQKILAQHEHGFAFDASKGSVKGYMRQMARNFACDWHRTASAQKRGGSVEKLPFD